MTSNSPPCVPPRVPERSSLCSALPVSPSAGEECLARAEPTPAAPPATWPHQRLKRCEHVTYINTESVFHWSVFPQSPKVTATLYLRIQIFFFSYNYEFTSHSSNFSQNSEFIYFYFSLLFSHLADAFIQSDLQIRKSN